MIVPRLRFSAQLARFWGASGSIRGRFCHMSWIAKNHEKHKVFIGFLQFGGYWKACLRHLGHWVKRSWLQDCIFWSILAICWDILVASWGQRAPRWRPRGPGGASMGGLEAPRREVPPGVEGNDPLWALLSTNLLLLLANKPQDS